MDLVREWTGSTASALQAALRETNESFASRLGVSVRAVASWHERPNLKPRADVQQLLDRVFETATQPERSRFQTIVGTGGEATTTLINSPGNAHRLRVAVAVVTNGLDVLIVHRRGDDGAGISWQFPAGMVKPGVSPETVAIRETFAETGVRCRIVRSLGSRLHPLTRVYCDYLLCEYLSGEVENLDIAENVDATWSPIERLTRFIPIESIFLPILEALKELANE